MREGICFFLSFCAFFTSYGQELKRHVYTFGKGNKGFYYLHVNKYSIANGIKLANPMQLILNERGEITYYRITENASDFKLHSNGLMSFFLTNKYYIMDQHFHIIDSVGCVNGTQTDTHELLILPNGNYLLMGLEETQMDLSEFPIFLQHEVRGSKFAKVKTGVIQELNSKKELVYEWRAKEYFKIEQADPFFLNDTQKVDLTHFNSVQPTPDGNLLIFARYYNEIFKVNKQNGKILWRFGGKNNQFRFIGDTIPFLGQHDAREISPNHITLFDNGYAAPGKQHGARALEYALDTLQKTARLVWSYVYQPGLVVESAGNAQRLPNGNTLINYGRIAAGVPNITFVVANKAGEKVMELYFEDTLYSYRTFGYLSLPESIKRPAILAIADQKGSYKLSTDMKGGHYKWSTGDTSAVIQVHLPGEYHVYISCGEGGFIRSETFLLKGKGRRQKQMGALK